MTAHLAAPESGGHGEASPPASVVHPLWRLALFVLACSVGVLGLRAILAPLNEALQSAVGVRLPTFVLMMAGGLLIGYWVTFRVVEPSGWDRIGLSRRALTVRTVTTGVLIGALAVGIPSLLLLAIGWLRVEPTAAGNLFLAAVSSLGVLLPAALWEELATRGYLFVLIRERFGARAAILATSLLFGAMHWSNAGATAQSVLLVALAGILLGSILVATGSLWAAWAAHVAWNFVMAAGMHSAVSGIGMGTPNYRTVDAGPDWATGGSWGPEAGLFTAVGILASVFILYRRRAGRGA